MRNRFLVGFLYREAKLLVEDDGGDVVGVDVQVDDLYTQPSYHWPGSLRSDYIANITNPSDILH